MKKILERRKYKRFLLALPTRLEVITSERKQVFNLLTRNVSAGGAYFNTDTPILEGTQVRVGLTIATDKLKELTDSKTLIRVKGRVNRADPGGIAVCFDEDYRILRLISQ